MAVHVNVHNCVNMYIQSMKLRSDIGHFPSICGTCPRKSHNVLPYCLNDDECAYARAIKKGVVPRRTCTWYA